ncbi:hypothetical protein A1D22_02030 [Pasteurellaceae bacterium LFhippo2]|nr:hypothetical protein [Pasteurellaceae bacterium LFhippo2]
MKKLLQAVIFLLFSANISAHGLFISAQYDGNEVSGKAYYSDQHPAVETYVEVVKQGESEPIVYGKTDKEGRFHLPLTQDGTFSVIIEGMEGHRAETQVHKIATASSTSTDLQLLREEIEQLKNKIYIRDVIGGIGYIFGIFGLVLFLRTKRDK